MLERSPDEASPVVALLRRVGSSTTIRPAVVLLDDDPAGRPTSAAAPTPDAAPGGAASRKEAAAPSAPPAAGSRDVLDAELRAFGSWRLPVVSALIVAALSLSFAFALALVDGDEELGAWDAAFTFFGVGCVLAVGAVVGGWLGHRRELVRLQSLRATPGTASTPKARDRRPDRAQVEDLWRFYDEHASQTRQNESLRATAISIMAGFAGVLAAVAGQDGLGRADLPAASIVTVLGVLGLLLNLSHYAKSREHIGIMGEVRDEIEAFGGADTNTVRERGEQRFARPLSLLDDDLQGRQFRRGRVGVGGVGSGGAAIRGGARGVERPLDSDGCGGPLRGDPPDRSSVAASLCD